MKKRLLSEADWAMIIRKYRRKHKHCELCGPAAKRVGSLVCHEDWGYAMSASGQPVAMLRRLQMLCGHCHNMLHGNYQAEMPEAKRQDIACWLAEKNKLPLEQMLCYYDAKLQEQQEFSIHPLSMWVFDISLFQSEGVIEAGLGADLRDAAGFPVITIRGLHVSYPHASQFSSPQGDCEASVGTNTWPHTDAPVKGKIAHRPVAYACVLVAVLAGAACYGYAHWNGRQEPVMPVVAVPGAGKAQEKRTVNKPQQVISQKQATAYKRTIKCPTGTTRVISIGQDKLCCDASGTCNKP